MCTLLDISWAIGLFLSWFFLHCIPYFHGFETIYHMLDLEFCARRYSDLKLRQSCCPKFAQANFGSLERILPRLSEFGAADWVFTAKNSLERIYFAQANLSDPRRDYKRQKLIFWRYLRSKGFLCGFGGEEGGFQPHGWEPRVLQLSWSLEEEEDIQPSSSSWVSSFPSLLSLIIGCLGFVLSLLDRLW